eukprot:scaffold13168_cov109-Isochrysis_galbana.AAC.1
MSKHPAYRFLTRFDDRGWRAHLPVLKPLGLNAVRLAPRRLFKETKSWPKESAPKWIEPQPPRRHTPEPPPASAQATPSANST